MSGIENVTGGNADDIILGNAGANVIEGLAGGDKLFGGAGTDTVSYKSSGASVIVDLSQQGSANIDGVPSKAAGAQSGGDAQGDLLYDFEIVVGSDYGDELYTAATGSTLYGGKGFDILNGNVGADTLYGEDDNDSFVASAGNDKIYGGDGTDTVYFDNIATGVTIALNNSAAVAATVSGGAASMQLFSVEWLYANRLDAVADKLTGNNADNWFTGAGGNDILSGMGGVDTLEGGDGDDTLIGGTSGDILDGGEGFDTLDYSASTTLVSVNLSDQGTYVGVDGTNRATSGPAQISGDASGDLLWSIERVVGSSKNDTLTASDTGLAVTLDDGTAMTFIIGGTGLEKLVGGLGIDTISYENSGVGVSVSLAVQGTYTPLTNTIAGGGARRLRRCRGRSAVRL